MTAYSHAEIESKWQAYWERHGTFRVPADIDTSKPKDYLLDMFPYPSADGLHVGYPRGYTGFGHRFTLQTRRGFNVHPMGWDAFDPSSTRPETGAHPRITTERSVNRFREQLMALGFSYDWEHEVNTNYRRVGL